MPGKPADPTACFFPASQRTAENEESLKHPLNRRSEVHGWMLARHTGLSRTGVNLIRVPPGKESFILHRHQADEEWVYVLSGRGVAVVDEARFEVGPGDFLGFPAGGPAHNLENPGPDELVYLCGGESHEVEVGDFPGIGKRLVRVGKQAELYPLHGEPMFKG